MKKLNNVEDENHSGFGGVNKLKISDIVIVVIITLLCLTCILPFVHLMSKSISGNTAVSAHRVYLLPINVTLEAYASIFKDGQLIHSMLYTVLLTTIYTVLGLVVSVCAAYPLSKKRLKGRYALTFLLMFTMYFSAGLIPEYLLLHDLGLLNKMWVLILPLVFSPYNMLIMKSFFQASIPDSLEESAFLDGASNFQILGKIVLPLSKPIIATISLFYAVGRWNGYADAKYYISTKALEPIQYLLSQMISANSDSTVSILENTTTATTPEVLQAAAVMFATIPIICIYPFVQKYFVKGAMIGAIKG